MTFKESSIAIVNDYDLPLTPEQFMQEITTMYHGMRFEKGVSILLCNLFSSRRSLAKALPGANRLMRHLHKHGVPFALASNSLRKNIDGNISHHDVREFDVLYIVRRDIFNLSGHCHVLRFRPGSWREGFSVILGSDQVKSGKPSPDIFLEAAKRMEVDPVRCLVIEDSFAGVKAGKAAGMKVVAVPSLQMESDSYSIADCTLHSLIEFQPEKWGLPRFGDWVGNTLPIGRHL